MNLTAERDFLKAYVLILALALFAYSCSGAVDSEFLRKVEQIESSGREWVIGDSGRARGCFQFHYPAWLDVSQYRAVRKLPTYPYQMATNRDIARLYAATYFHILQARFYRANNRAATRSELLVAYQTGFSRFRQRGFSLSKSPIKSQLAVQKLNK